MTLWARIDVQCVNIPAQAGGCGIQHDRPAALDESPWGLDCPACCAVLKTDPLFSAKRDELPQTPDQKQDRVDMAQRSARDRDRIMESVVAKLAGAQMPATPDGAVCRNGHPAESGMRFCGRCGVPMRHLEVAGEAGEVA